MGRPAKNVKIKTGRMRKEDEERRRIVEQSIQGHDDKIIPSTILNNRQIEIFNDILKELKESKILGNLDVYVLNQAAICIERLEKIDDMMNKDFNFIENQELRKSKDLYMKQFFRCCNELCLSPQARAKISISIAPKDDKKKTLADILGDDEDD